MLMLGNANAKQCLCSAMLMLGNAYATQLSWEINWTFKMHKEYDWVFGQKHLWHNKNSLKTKWFDHGFKSFQLNSAGQSANQGWSACTG